MKVDSSRSSYYSSSLFGQSSTSSDDDTPFALPDDDSEQKSTAASVSTASVGSTSVANSISSAFWQTQSASAATDATAATSAAGSDPTDDPTTGDASSDDILSEFAKWANMSPSDKIRAQYLEQQNLTEDQFTQLPSSQQQAINDQIADQIKQQTGTGETGASAEDGDSGAVSLG